jgi:hypothetical protein
MPDFDFRVTSGTITTPWDDRHLSHRGANVHKYRVVQPAALPAISEVVISCVVGGVVAPVDGALGGRLFVVSRLQWAGSFPFTISQAAAQSSLITLGFSMSTLGHQELVIRRDEGGAIILSFEVEEASA